MTQTLDDDVPVGDLKLYDAYVPTLAAGSWFVSVTHELTSSSGATVNADPLGAVQEMLVSAPQFAIDTTAVVAPYPPDTSTGKYGEVLPHVVLADPMLPWERSMPGSPRPPWLALLVLTDGEILDGEDSATRTVRTTVADLLKPADGVLVPAVTPEADVAGTDTCTSVRLPVDVFTAVVPRLDELRFLAHCRQVNTGDKAIDGLDEHGLFSVVVANRFPATPPAGEPGATKNVAHLVSLEGLTPYLAAGADLGSYTSVRLVSLASWSFYAQADNAADFRGLVEAIAASRTAALALPPVYEGSTDPDEVEVRTRLANGFVPLDYRTRTGETTYAWYRGPLAPVPTSPVPKAGPFPSADAAVVYDDARGVFDLSLAAAWQAGRACALADSVFGQRVLDFRARAQGVADALLNRLQSEHFTAAQVSEAVAQGSVQSAFANVLSAQLLADIGAGPAPVAPPVPPPSAPPAETDPKQAVADFLATAEAQDAVVTAVQGDLDPLAGWLASLMLLVPVPFGALVADPALLPVESLRFFYVDPSWTAAAIDGATSLGVDSSRQALLGEMTYGMLHDAAARAALVYRDTQRGTDPATDTTGAGVVTGMLLRSALVSGWPNLAVRPYDAAGALLATLRMDHLSPTVLLCLFDGVPSVVELSEPQEGFRFGSDEDGILTLRNVTSGTAPIGSQLTPPQPFVLRDMSGATTAHMRSAGSRVVDLDPGSPTGLVQELAAAVGAGAFGPADFALQMVNAPEAIRFPAPSGGTS